MTKRTYSAKILGVDPDSDLALLKIDEENLNFLKFADSDNLKVERMGFSNWKSIQS